jgi:para-aminobenzoate synthetase component I
MSVPVIHPLGGELSMLRAFEMLHSLGGCLWFDSAARGPELEPGGDHAGRYSFLCADPVDRIVAHVGDDNPWPQLRAWCAALPTTKIADLPPFQGGVAGLWGYEAGSWLESVGCASINDLPTPAVCVGLYDWVICHDRLRSQAWLISWGFESDGCQPNESRARNRAAAVLRRLDEAKRCTDVSSPVGESVAGIDALAPAYPTHWANVWSNFSPEQYRDAISSIIESIRNGDSFQVNLAQRLLTRAQCHASELMQNLRAANAAPFAGYLDGGSFQVISSSPEGFLRLRDGIVQTRPIKGTVARTGDERRDRELARELSLSEKDRAENVMIVDLMRNDLSRVCEDDSVRVSQLCGIETYAHVQHLVSVVEGRLRRDVGAIDLLAACFPGGSITGAPKIEAMKTIARLEPTRRGPYCGSLGYVSTGGDAEFNILIRTITATQGWWQIPVGGGITMQSDPASEERETWVKAEGMLRAMKHATQELGSRA